MSDREVQETRNQTGSYSNALGSHGPGNYPDRAHGTRKLSQVRRLATGHQLLDTIALQAAKAFGNLNMSVIRRKNHFSWAQNSFSGCAPCSWDMPAAPRPERSVEPLARCPRKPVYLQ